MFPKKTPIFVQVGPHSHLVHISIGFGLVGLLDLRVLHEYFVDVGAGILVQLLVVAYDNESHIDVTEDTQLIRLLQQAVLPLAEGDLWGGTGSVERKEGRGRKE